MCSYSFPGDLRAFRVYKETPSRRTAFWGLRGGYSRLRSFFGKQEKILVKNEKIRLLSTLGAYCLLAPHKEHMIKRNFLPAILSKRPVSPKSGQEALFTLRFITPGRTFFPLPRSFRGLPARCYDTWPNHLLSIRLLCVFTTRGSRPRYLLTAPGTHVCCHLLRVHRAKDASLSLRERSLPLFFRNESLQQYVPES